MRQLREFAARLRGLFSPDRQDQDISEEFQAHLDMETAEFIRRGMAPDEARRQALLAAGGLTQAREAVRAQRGLPWIESLGADLHYATRSLRHSPAFAAVVIVTLALAIGANTAIFSVVRGVLLKPLPHREGERLVYLRQSMDGPGGANILFSVPEVEDYRAGAKSLTGIAEYSPFTFTLRGEADATRLRAGLVTGNFFEVMGLAPILGRVTSATDNGIGVPPVMVLTYEYWQRRFNGDSAIVGRQLRVDDKSVTVIGVLERAPSFPDRVDVFMNMVVSEHHTSAMMVQGRTHRMTEMTARLAPGATLSQVRAEVAAVHARQVEDHPDAYDPASHVRVTVLPFKEAIGQRAQLTVWMLMAAAAFVLVIAAANVANLALMRGIRREPELVARAALGAGTGRLRRLLLAENLLLTSIGGALGVAVALGGVRLLIALAERYSPRAGEIRIDAAVLGFSVAVSLVLALILSWVVSLPREGTFANLIAAGGRRASGGLRRQRVQRALVVAQVAVSVVLLAGAGLLTRTLIHLSQVDTGLRTEEVLSMDVPLLEPSQALVPGFDAAVKERYARILADVRAIPGVVDVGLGSPAPLRRSGVRFEVKAENTVLAVGEAMPRAELRTANPDYFSAAGIPLLRGRTFNLADHADAARVVIINRSLADRYFRDEDPVGKRIAWTGDVLRFTPISGEWRTIVGVAENTQDGGMDAAPAPVVFMPFAQMIALGGTLVIRADSNVARMAPMATRVVRRLAPGALIENVRTIPQVRDESMAPRRLNAALISSFGLLAVLIAAVGIAGVLAFSVSARTNEIGIRMSLGADRGRVERMILAEGGALLVVGLVLGVIAAVSATGVMRGLLFGVTPQDPVTLVGVAVLMAVIGLVACWVPAFRASRIDPAITLRAQ